MGRSGRHRGFLIAQICSTASSLPIQPRHCLFQAYQCTAFKVPTRILTHNLKLQTLGHISGDVLDTCTGLGYTAILAAKKATSVVTVEVDPVVLELARLNPWSKELFDDPKIQQIVGDIAEEIKRFNDNEFSYIIHDPPTISLAGELYSSAFYREMYRVLKPKGELFHYVGNSSSKSGRSTTKGVSQRRRGAGFSVVRSEERAFGLVALKST